MPNKKNAKKELRKAKKRTEANAFVKKEVKEIIKKSQKSLETKEATAKETVFKAMKTLDKAAQKGVIKKNTAARKKSRLHKKLNATLK